MVDLFLDVKKQTLPMLFPSMSSTCLHHLGIKSLFDFLQSHLAFRGVPNLVLQSRSAMFSVWAGFSTLYDCMTAQTSISESELVEVLFVQSGTSSLGAFVLSNNPLGQ